MRQRIASFSNFVCRFGEQKVLLDYATEIVIPAFCDDTLIRSYGSTEFFFFETELMKLNDDEENPALGIVGRLDKKYPTYSRADF